MADDEAKLKEDLLDRAEDVTGEVYERLPVESFGASLLASMGWKYDAVVGGRRVGRGD